MRGECSRKFPQADGRVNCGVNGVAGVCHFEKSLALKGRRKSMLDLPIGRRIGALWLFSQSGSVAVKIWP